MFVPLPFLFKELSTLFLGCEFGLDDSIVITSVFQILAFRLTIVYDAISKRIDEGKKLVYYYRAGLGFQILLVMAVLYTFVFGSEDSIKKVIYPDTVPSAIYTYSQESFIKGYIRYLKSLVDSGVSFFGYSPIFSDYVYDTPLTKRPGSPFIRKSAIKWNMLDLVPRSIPEPYAKIFLLNVDPNMYAKAMYTMNNIAMHTGAQLLGGSSPTVEKAFRLVSIAQMTQNTLEWNVMVACTRYHEQHCNLAKELYSGTFGDSVTAKSQFAYHWLRDIEKIYKTFTFEYGLSMTALLKVTIEQAVTTRSLVLVSAYALRDSQISNLGWSTAWVYYWLKAYGPEFNKTIAESADYFAIVFFTVSALVAVGAFLNDLKKRGRLYTGDSRRLEKSEITSDTSKNTSDINHVSDSDNSVLIPIREQEQVVQLAKDQLDQLLQTFSTFDFFCLLIFFSVIILTPVFLIFFSKIKIKS